MKKILVPTDFSSYAERALQYAIEVVKRSNGEIFLLNVSNQLDAKFTRHKNLINEHNEKQINEASNKLKEIGTLANEEGVNVTSLIYGGEITETIIWVAQQHKVDTIIMGTLGATGLKTVIFGTKTAAVIQESTLPVITIPHNYQWKEPKHILLALNDADEEPSLFEPAFQLAALFGAHVSTVIFTDEREEAVNVIEHSRAINKVQMRLSQHYEDRSIETVHLSGKDFHDSLQDYIDKQNIDLLVMVTHKRTFIQNVFKASLTRQMAYHTTIPLLSFHSMHH